MGAQDGRKQNAEQLVDALAFALDRAHVVGVLDGWLLEDKWRHYMLEFCESSDGRNFTVTLGFNRDMRTSDWKSYRGTTPDLVRAAAAKAIESGEV